MALPDTDPNAPATGDQGADHPPDSTATQNAPPADADPGADSSLFTEEEVKGLTPDLQKRVQGMVKKFTQTQQLLAKERENLSQLTALAREQMAARGTEEPAGDVQTSATDELDALLSRAAPAEKELIRALTSAIEGRVSKQFAPLLKKVTEAGYRTEREAVAREHPDFSQVVTEARANAVLTKYPAINSYEALYKLCKYDEMEKEARTSKSELQKFHARMKQTAATELPGGLSAEAIESSEFKQLTKEQRRKLTPLQIMDMAARDLASR